MDPVERDSKYVSQNTQLTTIGEMIPPQSARWGRGALCGLAPRFATTRGTQMQAGCPHAETDFVDKRQVALSDHNVISARGPDLPIIVRLPESTINRPLCPWEVADEHVHQPGSDLGLPGTIPRMQPWADTSLRQTGALLRCQQA